MARTTNCHGSGCGRDTCISCETQFPTDPTTATWEKTGDELEALRRAVRELLLALDDEKARDALRVSTWTYVTRVRALLPREEA